MSKETFLVRYGQSKIGLVEKDTSTGLVAVAYYSPATRLFQGLSPTMATPTTVQPCKALSVAFTGGLGVPGVSVYCSGRQWYFGRVSPLSLERFLASRVDPNMVNTTNVLRRISKIDDEGISLPESTTVSSSNGKMIFQNIYIFSKDKIELLYKLMDEVAKKDASK